MTSNLIPVTLLTGFLGAGKTTALNHLLDEASDEKIAVIVNEFGEIGIDEGLVLKAEDDILEMNNGCICCATKGDLGRMLMTLVKRREKIDRVVVETTGLADPSPIAVDFIEDRALRNFYKLDAIVTLVDCHHILMQLDRSPEPARQIGFADLVVLNKIDLAADGDHLDLVEAKVRHLNPSAHIVRTQNARIDKAIALDIGGFDPTRIQADDPAFHSHEHHGHDHDHEDHGHIHDKGVTSVSLALDEPLDGARIDAWLRGLVKHHGDDLYRMKGILNLAGQSRRCVFHGIHHLIGANLDRPWGEQEVRRSKMVFIGRGLDRDLIEEGVRECIA